MERGYRADIDGLRAIAVGLVVLFHLRIPGLEAGFAGVDIFFVVSGYLITGHVLRDIAARRFSFAAFYLRRARRILPALIATIMLSLLAGWLYLAPEFLRQLAKEATHGLLSISNIQYWREADQYFAPSADQLALLHLWSLSVEAQFYLVSPLVLVLLSRTRYVFSAIALTGLLSLLAGLVWLPHDPEAVFFLTPFRVFEFVLGALAIPLEGRLAASSAGRFIAAAAGYVLLIGSLLFIGRFQGAGGIAALPPCLATAAIIAANRPMRLLANPAVLAVGRSSYSLYLVHWPVIFFARFIFGAAAETLGGIAAQLAAMAVLTAVQFVTIEQPLRRLHLAKWKQAAGFAAVIVACVVITYGSFRADGVIARMPADRLALLKLQSFGLEACAKRTDRDCAFGDINGSPSLELTGDSFVQQYVAALDAPLKARALAGHTSTVSGCPVLIGVSLPGPRERQCAEYRDRELERVKQSPANVVVIGQAWQVYVEVSRMRDGLTPAAALAEHVAATIRFLDRPGRRFLVIGAQVRPLGCSFDRLRMLPGPLWHRPPKPCEPLSKNSAVADGGAIDQSLAEALARYANVMLLRPSEVYCDENCPVVQGRVWLFQDAGHFTVAGAERMGERASAIIAKILSGE
ncbi:acyltransferase family protein [Bradyrhizobium sp. HKCCYLS1011]|uniref:acyltransferase family protein n=1 Tax=Bradyrhizobium sp. HKCCYLS1011 TaxID=3420733 RepID=UPI003EB72966